MLSEWFGNSLLLGSREHGRYEQGERSGACIQMTASGVGGGTFSRGGGSRSSAAVAEAVGRQCGTAINLIKRVAEGFEKRSGKITWGFVRVSAGARDVCSS
jgi:hypothetical protein